MTIFTVIAALAAAQSATPAAQPDLDWLAGYWLSCEEGIQVSETWSRRRVGIMLGNSITTGDDAFGWEQTRIEADADGLTFHALPRSQPPADFRLVRSGPEEAIFENPDHDFPQRVIYRRNGDRLTARIEGTATGREQAMEWHYRSSPLNSDCGNR
jgi:hypothetical protein